MAKTYDIYIRTGPSKSNYGGFQHKDVFLREYTVNKAITKKIKILPLMINFSASGKSVSQLVRYKIIGFGYPRLQVL
jgi:hypothetical protein